MILHEPVPLPSYIDEVVLGLTSRPKTLPCKLFYDERGSQLFEEITRLPEYYPTRTEFEILQDSCEEICEAAGIRFRWLNSVRELQPRPARCCALLLAASARQILSGRYFLGRPG